MQHLARCERLTVNKLKAFDTSCLNDESQNQYNQISVHFYHSKLNIYQTPAWLSIWKKRWSTGEDEHKQMSFDGITTILLCCYQGGTDILIYLF